MYGLEDLYRFLCPLGRGAEGEVYLVEDLYRGGTLCALKILPGRGGLPLEFRRLARLRHRALARVLDSGTVPAAGRGYFTSEYFPGRSILSLPAPFSWPFFEGLLREACSALACLNDAGLRHGDLKSAHILYSPPPQPLLRIIDLGHAARLDDARPLSAGTLPYAAPELWGGPGAPGRSTDLYALGMTCVELISGSWPVPAGDREEWRQWHLQGDREMVLREATLTPPPHLLSLIRGLIEPDPADRPRDAEELLPHLRRWEGVAVPPPPPPPLVGRDAMLRELLDWLAAPGGEGAEARILTGPAGVGKSRLLASLLRLAQGAGIAADHLNGAILAQEGTALRTRLEHTLGSGDQGRALLIDDLDPGAGAGGLPFPRWWRRLRESLSRPWPRLVAVLQGTGDAQAAQGLVEALQTDGIPAEQLHLPPLNRDETVQLLEHVGRGEPPTAQEEEAAWRQSLGYPGKIIHLCGAEASERPRARPLDPHLEALLRALPAPVPLEALLAALAWPAERLWAELAAAGDTAPPVAGVAPELRVHPLPRSSARGSPPVPREILLGLAEEWRRLGGIDADWGPELIERIAGREPAPGSLALLRLRLREDRRWGPLEAVAELSRGTCAAARWDLLLAWTHRGRVGEARALMDEGAEEVTSLEAWQAAAAASLLVRAGSPVEALPYLEHAVGVARTPQARLGHATEAVRLALSLGRREQAQRLLATLEDGGLLSETGLLRLEPPSAQGLAALLVSMGRSQLAETLFHQALAGARKLGRKGAATVISALSGLAGGSRSRSDLAEAERLLRLGIRYARHAGLSGEARHLEANLAAVQYSRRQPDLALATYRRLEKRVRREGNLRLLPHVGLGIGTIHRERGDLLRALRTLARAARDARASGNDPARAAVLANLGELYLLLGDPRSSYRSRLEVLRIARRIGDHSLIRQARCALGGSLVRLGRVREAHRMLEEALEMEGEDTGLRVRAVIHASLAEARELEEDSGGALRCWARASRDALRSHRSYVASRSITGLARAVAQRGDPQRAQRLLDRAAEIARSDPCPALSRIPARLERLRLDWQPGGARRALARELRNLYDTAMRYGLREEALAVVYLLGQREGEDQEDPRPSLPGAATLLAGFRRRMGGTEVAALGRRLGLPGLSGMMPGEILFRGPLPVAIQHLPAEERGVGGKGALALDRLRRRWRATRAQLLCFHDGELARWGMATESEAHLETLPHPCNEGAAPRRPAQARKGALEQREQGTWARIPLALPGKEAAFLLLDLPTPAPPPPSEEDLRVLETELAERIGAWRRHSDREEIGRLRKLVDHLREETLAEKERLETEILTQRLELQQAQENLRDGDPTGVKAPRWVALAPEMQRIERNLEAWSATRLPVLLHGESGVGKSALARRLHQAGPRRDSILLVENCTALPEPLLEAELFGYRRGAFTSADRDHPGLLERAAGGTLLLDHLDELPPTTQAKLLRVLDDGRFRPLGSGEELELDLRLMTTCRRPPREATRDGLLREDLYYRLQGIEIEIPPLRERRQEIEPLLTGFLQWHGRRLHLPVPAITAESLRLLLDYSWPGNVRELANLSQRWLIQRLRTITPEDFAPAARTPSPSTSLFRSELPWRQAVAEFQRRFLRAALEAHEWNQRRTAEALGLSRRHLQNLLSKLGLRGDRQG